MNFIGHISTLQLLSKKAIISLTMAIALAFQPLKSQNIEAQSIAYNSLIGAVTGGLGALINKHEGEKWHKVFLKGLSVGAGKTSTLIKIS